MCRSPKPILPAWRSKLFQLLDSLCCRLSSFRNWSLRSLSDRIAAWLFYRSQLSLNRFQAQASQIEFHRRATGIVGSIRGAVALFVSAFSAVSCLASNYVYLVDTSASMKPHRAAMLERVSVDMGRALVGQNRLFHEGDQILLWSFNLDVQERLKLNFKSGSESELRAQISSALNRPKMEGRTSLARPLSKALEQFGPNNSADLSVVLYTDGRELVGKRDADYLVRLFNFYYQTNSRLSNLILVRFGSKNLPNENSNLITSLGGGIIGENDPLLFKGAKATPPNPVPTEAKPPPKITVAPKVIRLSSALSSEINQTVPVEFKVDPPMSGVIVQLGLEATNLPSGMIFTTTSDRLATEGRQAISFAIKGAQKGHFTAKLHLSAPVAIEPEIIPIDLDVTLTNADRVEFQFFSEPGTTAELTGNGQWHKVQTAGLSLFYPDSLKDALVHFDAEVPAGIELQMLGAGDPTKPIELKKTVKLASLGRIVGIQMRQTTPDFVGKDQAARIAFRFEPGQNIQADGVDALTLPFRFVSAGEVQVDSNEISLGQIPRGATSVKRTLTLQVKGEAAGKKIRLVKKGQGLAGLTIRPDEFVLTAGPMSVDLDFGGFETRAPGAIDGTLLLAAEETSAVDLRGGILAVRGTIPPPGSVITEVENPMVVGQPFIIRAKLDAQINDSFHAIIRPPDSMKEFEISLADSGSAEDGDVKPNDGIFSGMFKRTESLGKYQVSISSARTRGANQTVTLNVPLYFKPQTDPLVGNLVSGKPGGYLQFKPKVFSDYPGAIAVHVEAAEPSVPLNPYLSTKSLEAGENALDLVVGLGPDARPGEYKCKIYLVTDKIGDAKARIPITLEITVLSFFRYFMPMLSIILVMACAISVAVIAPWKKINKRGGPHRALPPFSQPEEETDETLAPD